MATKEQIYEWIRYTCPTDTDAEQVAEIVATKLTEENGSLHNKQSTLCKMCGSTDTVPVVIIHCNSCGCGCK